jgi:hypothetical protein
MKWFFSFLEWKLMDNFNKQYQILQKSFYLIFHLTSFNFPIRFLLRFNLKLLRRLPIVLSNHFQSAYYKNYLLIINLSTVNKIIKLYIKKKHFFFFLYSYNFLHIISIIYHLYTSFFWKLNSILLFSLKLAKKFILFFNIYQKFKLYSKQIN